MLTGCQPVNIKIREINRENIRMMVITLIFIVSTYKIFVRSKNLLENS